MPPPTPEARLRRKGIYSPPPPLECGFDMRPRLDPSKLADKQAYQAFLDDITTTYKDTYDPDGRRADRKVLQMPGDLGREPAFDNDRYIFLMVGEGPCVPAKVERCNYFVRFSSQINAGRQWECAEPYIRAVYDMARKRFGKSRVHWWDMRGPEPKNGGWLRFADWAEACDAWDELEAVEAVEAERERRRREMRRELWIMRREMNRGMRTREMWMRRSEMRRREIRRRVMRTGMRRREMKKGMRRGMRRRGMLTTGMAEMARAMEMARMARQRPECELL